jgi:hypothetical protein
MQAKDNNFSIQYESRQTDTLVAPSVDCLLTLN